MSAFAYARATLRLILLAVVTHYTVLRLRAEIRRNGACPHAAMRRGHAWARAMTRLLGVRVRVHGEPPREPALLLGNHRSYLDIPVILAQLPCAFLAKAEIGEWPLFGEAARLHHTVLVRREDPDSRKRSREETLRLLQRRISFAAFPEGTTSYGPGRLPFYPGLFRLAEQYAVPVVPLAIEYHDRSDCWVGADSFLGHFLASFRKRRVDVTLRFGPLLRPGEVPDTKAWVEDWIDAQLLGGATT